MTTPLRTGIYPGSFNPFTKGHHDVVSRALKVLDKVVILLCVNPRKTAEQQTEQHRQQIEELYKNEPRVQVVCWNGLVYQFAQQTAGAVLVRGVRTASDFEYEQAMAAYHLQHHGLDTLLLTSRPALSYISSSLVRELEAFGEDASEFLPPSPPHHPQKA